jgi:integrase
MTAALTNGGDSSTGRGRKPGRPRSRPGWSSCCALTWRITASARTGATSGACTAGRSPSTVYDRWWKLSREKSLTEAQVASPLVRRPYDLRHAAASLWLNAGVPPTEVARRLGHGVAVLLRVYANCIDGGDDTINDRIGGALG